ncbi:DNA-directed RNA polymerase subunit beta [Paenibacillus protaetiae]|uniref:DNA-directed RNA polymerase subunit beta n=1 Tax=Paenibacillus protaetiae TaxID=2509456 RepID=A0A4P6EWI2_9BACL|nr:DNA-directed RNA polymerase subunit beta [Paenibacillus protaetiae]QAY67730.1 DNA-directed RNA polymerase subunit beta [Paenibacillus protaetiae]
MADERAGRTEGLGNRSEDNNRLSRRQSEASEPEKARRSPAVRTLLWILRKGIVPLIMVIMLAVGLYIGYTKLGKGSSGDVFHWSTWKHVYDLIFGDA